MRSIALATSLHELSPSDLALADALRRAGFTAQPAVWSDARQPWDGFDAVIVRSCWDYHLHLDAFLRWIAALEHAGVAVINEPGLIRWNAEKTYLAELAAKGVAIPDTIFLEAGEHLDLESTCAARGWASAVVKPTVSASAHRTERRASGRVDGPALVQQYVAAIETAGEWSLLYFDHQFSHAVLKRARAGEFRVQKEYGGTAEGAQPPAEALAFAGLVLERLPHRAIFARVDLIADGTSIRLMELEAIEPELFLDRVSEAADRLVAAIRAHLRRHDPRSRHGSVARLPAR